MTKKVTKRNLQYYESLDAIWKKFSHTYPTEEACAVFVRRWYASGGSMRCSACEFKNDKIDFEKRFFQCERCKKKIWILSGTLFKKVRKFRPWLAAIYFIENGMPTTSCEFAKLLDVATSTALSIFKKISVVIESKLAENSELLPSMMFLPTFTRRSRETPAKMHPQAEELAASRKNKTASTHSLNQQKAVDPAISKSDLKKLRSMMGSVEKEIVQMLADGPKSINFLHANLKIEIEAVSAALANLEVFDVIQRLPGETYQQCALAHLLFGKAAKGSAKELSAMKRRNAFVNEFSSLVKEFYGGISRKYLQNYLSLYWAYIDRDRWKEDTLMNLCVQFPEIGDNEILNYVTPLKARIPNIAAA